MGSRGLHQFSKRTKGFRWRKYPGRGQERRRNGRKQGGWWVRVQRRSELSAGPRLKPSSHWRTKQSSNNIHWRFHSSRSHGPSVSWWQRDVRESRCVISWILRTIHCDGVFRPVLQNCWGAAKLPVITWTKLHLSRFSARRVMLIRRSYTPPPVLVITVANKLNFFAKPSW